MKYLFKHKSLHKERINLLSKTIGGSNSKLRKHLNHLIGAGHIIQQKDLFQLTAKGNMAAQDLVRAHRLWETFLVDKVGLKDTEIHADAEKYEHLLSTEMLDQLDAKLGYPSVDPHGSPIPSKDDRPENPLINLSLKQKGIISDRQINDSIESQLWELGLPPHSSIQIEAIKAEHVIIRSKNREIIIPASLAHQVNID